MKCKNNHPRKGRGSSTPDKRSSPDELEITRRSLNFLPASLEEQMILFDPKGRREGRSRHRKILSSHLRPTRLVVVCCRAAPLPPLYADTSENPIPELPVSLPCSRSASLGLTGIRIYSGRLRREDEETLFQKEKTLRHFWSVTRRFALNSRLFPFRIFSRVREIVDDTRARLM